MRILLERFRELPDYKKSKQLKFNVGEVMYISLLAILSGANGYMDIVTNNTKKISNKSTDDRCCSYL